MPRSGIPAGIGFAKTLNVPCHHAIIAEDKRTFIESDPTKRRQKADEKYQIVEDMVRGKIVVVVDDSCIKGLTVSTITKKLFEAGAKEVHFRSASPEYIFPCAYGASTKDVENLFARDKNKEDRRRAAGSPTSLEFLSIKRFKSIIERFGRGHCYACFTGEYPVPLQNSHVA